MAKKRSRAGMGRKASDGKAIPGSVIAQTQVERLQGHETRKPVIKRLGTILGRSVVTYFTSFVHPVSIEDEDVDILEGVLRATDLSSGLALMVSSPGGNGLAAERIVNLCRRYSATGEFIAIVPSKAKSAATMICFGSSRILMGPSSELGPVDPQLIEADQYGHRRQFSIYNVVKSYDKLFKRATTTKGNLAPFLQQLEHYDERDIEEFRSLLAVTDDYAVRTLSTGMMSGLSDQRIRRKVAPFLQPETKKVHGRPIFLDEAEQCGLKVESVDECGDSWAAIYELYIRTNTLVSSRCAKCIESESYSFSVGTPEYDE